MRKLEYALHQ
jgi:hypothetical protein